MVTMVVMGAPAAVGAPAVVVEAQAAAQGVALSTLQCPALSGERAERVVLTAQEMPV